jgi:hypothetical protein
MGYKLRLASTSFLSKDIQKKAVALVKSRVKVARLNERLGLSFEKLKKANVEPTKLAVQQAKLKEAHPALINLHAKQEALVKDISSSIMYDAVHLLKEIEDIYFTLKRIILDADVILYRESKTLDKFHREIIKLENKEMALKLINQINSLKEEMKTVARRLYESAKSPALLKKPFKKKKVAVSKQLILLSAETSEIDALLKRLNVTKIDEITKDAEKELIDLAKIELAVFSLFPELSSHLSHLRSRLYLLDKPVSGRLGEKISNSESILNRVLKKISFNAEKLFEEIIISEKIKK